jgi:glycosyltransferase involved in cell wall biosynthesis
VLVRHPAAQTTLFPNGVDPALFDPAVTRPADRASLGLRRDAFVLGYAGNFGRAHAIEQVIWAADRLRHRHDIQFFLMGAGTTKPYIIQLVREMGLDNVIIRDPVPHPELPSIQRAWDAAVVPLADLPLTRGVRSAKYFEFAAMGLPVLYCGVGEGASIARAMGSVVIHPERPNALKQAILALAEMTPETLVETGKQVRSKVVLEFDRAAIALELESRLQSVVNAARSKAQSP